MKSLVNLFFLISGLILAFSCSSNKKGQVSDIEGNVYTTITIGSQTWMAENLKTAKYNDGTVIPEIKVDSVWSTMNSGALSWFNNDPAGYKDSYGAYYNWYAVSTGKLCPTGWHVPSDKEWRALTGFLGDEMVAGKEMKSTSGWARNGNGINSSGFSGLPFGFRNHKGRFGSQGNGGYWWSNTANAANAWYCVLFAKDNTASKYYGLKESGFSVRCLRN